MAWLSAGVEFLTSFQLSVLFKCDLRFFSDWSTLSITVNANAKTLLPNKYLKPTAVLVRRFHIFWHWVFV